MTTLAPDVQPWMALNHVVGLEAPCGNSIPLMVSTSLDNIKFPLQLSFGFCCWMLSYFPNTETSILPPLDTLDYGHFSILGARGLD